MAKRPPRKKEREKAFSKAGTGQFTPGALSKASTQYFGGGTRRSVAPSLSGGLSDPNRDVHTLAPPSIPSEQDFANEFMRKREMQSMVQEMPVMAGAAGDVLSRDTEITPVAQEQRTGVTGAYDALNEMSYAVINTALDFIENQGGGDFQKGIYSLITAPMGAVGVSGSIVRDSAVLVEQQIAGTITKQALAKGGVKSLGTIKNFVAKVFTKDEVIRYVDDAGKLAYRQGRVSRITPWGVMKAITAAGGIAVAAAYLRLSGLQSQAIGIRDVKEELGGYLGMQARDMYRDGNTELGNMFMDMAVDGTNVTISAMPGGKGTVQGSNIYQDALNITAPLIKKHYEEMADMEAEGMTPEGTSGFWGEYHERVEANKTLEEKKRVDYFNQQHRISVQFELDARATQRINEANFWLKYRERLAKMAEEERKKQAEFWFEYKKMVLKLQAETGRSRLSFGLLR